MAYTNAELIELQQYISSLPRKETAAALIKYYPTMTAAEKITFGREGEKFAAAEEDRINREMATRRRERYQAFAKKSVVFVGAAAALPTLVDAFSPPAAGMGTTASGLPYITDVGLASSLQPAAAAGMGVTASGLPYITDAGLASSLQPAGMGVTASGLPYITDAGLASSLQPAAAKAGILESIGKAFAGGIDTLANYATKIGGIIGTAGGIFGVDGEDLPTTVQPGTPAPSTPASTQPLTISMAGLIPPQSTGGIVLSTPPAAEEPNYMLYAGIGILAIILLKGL